MFSLPTQMGGLNLLDPTVTSCANYTTSKRLTGPIVNALKQISSFDYDEFHSHYVEVQESISKEREVNLDRVFEDIFTKLTSSQQRAISRAKNEKISSCLNVIPVAKHHFDLSAQEFRDGLALRYKKLCCVFLPPVMAVKLPLTSLTLLFVEKMDLLPSNTMRFVTLLATSFYWPGVKSLGSLW